MVERTSGTEHVIATFRLPRIRTHERAAVVGEFNSWSEDANPMVAGDDGFEAQIALEPGRVYRYRYLLDGETWENDWEADAYVPNEFGGDDSVIDLTDAALAEAAASPKPAKKAARRAPKPTA